MIIWAVLQDSDAQEIMAWPYQTFLNDFSENDYKYILETDLLYSVSKDLHHGKYSYWSPIIMIKSN